MIAGITFLTTWFSKTVGGRIRWLFLRSLEDPLRSVAGLREEVSPLPEATTIRGERQALGVLDRKWRGMLGLNKSPLEMLKNWRFFGAYLLCGLITTAIVTAFTPTPVIRTVAYHPVIPDANYGEYIDVHTHPCVGIVKSGLSLGSYHYWDLSNGSSFYGSTDLHGCPTSKALALSAGINSGNPSDYAYVDSGIATHPTALGASAAVFKSPVFQKLSGEYGLSLVNTTQCVPVMQYNPVQCSIAGNTTVVNDQQLSVTSPDGSCSYTGTYPFRNLTRDSVMASWLCSKGNSTTDEIGLGTIVFGAFTDPNGQQPWASDLAGTMNDQTANVGRAGGSTYAVTCTINPRNVFTYRTVTLNVQAGKIKEGSNYTYYLSGGEPCTPIYPTISNILFVTAAIANHNLVWENLGLDQYFSAIHNAAGFNRGPPYAFTNSRNALEDTLGLVAALAVSNVPFSGGNVSADATENLGGSAYALVEATRLGTNALEGLLLLIPPVGSFLILTWLLLNNFLSDRGPGGVAYKDLPEKEHPRRYAAVSIRELMLLGSHGRMDNHSAPLSPQSVENKRPQVAEQSISQQYFPGPGPLL
jgi:hypothetical protein